MMVPMRRGKRYAIAACAAIAFWAPSAAADEDTDGASRQGSFYLDTSFFPGLNVQMIEGPNRDDTVTNDWSFTSSMNLTYAVTEWLEPGLHYQLDGGEVRRALFSRPDPQTGETVETDAVEGAFWEQWFTLFARARFDPVFVELGWAPLILRRDTSRTDLPNVNGETSGTFVGSRTVAWLAAFGGAVPITPDVDLTLRLQFRIRYLVSRGGEDLADEEEFGNMFFTPTVGLGHRF